MSIEWLLTKAADTEAHGKKLKRDNEAGGPSDNVSGSKPIKKQRTVRRKGNIKISIPRVLRCKTDTLR